MIFEFLPKGWVCWCCYETTAPSFRRKTSSRQEIHPSWFGWNSCFHCQKKSEISLFTFTPFLIFLNALFQACKHLRFFAVWNWWFYGHCQFTFGRKRLNHHHPECISESQPSQGFWMWKLLEEEARRIEEKIFWPSCQL